MMKSKSKFMIKYLWILLIIGLTGCHTEPTDNKTETIKNWMSDFDSYILYSYEDMNVHYSDTYKDTYNNYYGLHMPFNFYGPILPYFLQSQKWICAPQPSNYPRSVINHKSSTKKSVIVIMTRLL